MNKEGASPAGGKGATPWAGRLCLITGASSGLGEALAWEAARRGADLVLTARREDRLDTLAEAIRAEQDIRVVTIAADLSTEGGTTGLIRSLEERALSPDALFLNAGAVQGGGFLTPTLDRHLAFETLMVRSPLMLSHALLPAMIAGGWGRVLIVSSVAALTPGTAGSPLYGASKAFLVKWGQSLAHEGEKAGVIVRIFCPGVMDTAIFEGNGMAAQIRALPRFLKMPVAEAAHRAFGTFDKSGTVHVPGTVNRLIAGLARLVTPRAAERLARRQSASRDGG